MSSCNWHTTFLHSVATLKLLPIKCFCSHKKMLCKLHYLYIAPILCCAFTGSAWICSSGFGHNLHGKDSVKHYYIPIVFLCEISSMHLTHFTCFRQKLICCLKVVQLIINMCWYCDTSEQSSKNKYD